MFIPASAINGNNKVVKIRQTSDDIVKYLLIAEKQSRAIYPILRAYFDGDDKIKVLQKIWTYAKQNIIYVREPAEWQTVRTVARIIKDAKHTGGDCKHMATFCVASARACGINAFFRLVSFTASNPAPSHVYAVAVVNKKFVYLDAVINNFDEQPPNIKSFEDVKPLI